MRYLSRLEFRLDECGETYLKHPQRVGKDVSEIGITRSVCTPDKNAPFRRSRDIRYHTLSSFFSLLCTIISLPEVVIGKCFSLSPIIPTRGTPLEYRRV